MEASKVQRLDFRELAEGLHVEVAAGNRIFMPSSTRQDKPPPPPPPPTFSEEELKSAERDGYKKGFLEGVEEGRKQAESEQAEINNKLVGTLDSFVKGVSPLFEDYRKKIAQLQQDMPALSLAIARKVASKALDENGHVVISEIAARCCETMIKEPKLTIIAHASLADTLENKLKQLAARLPEANHIIIMRDNDIPLTDCRIEWQHGSVEHSVAHIWEQVEKSVSSITATTVRDTNEQMEELKTQLPPVVEASGQTPLDETPTTEKE